ncbi:hypothetical protein [Lysobacter enzymogenes]|uniref:Transmembrane protein n=1 Tax=Lysobacter enzymogenes TaxID=69 RepID=A0A3N2RED0_LYSEN|nr:hypothetical protein [Lysobacter enzymogenes]ROU05807.1 hypothetical protein D9T17_16650 [Lysobacter enzymogenes]
MSSTLTMEIHRADLAYRRRSLWLLLAIAAGCALALWQLHGWLQSVQAHVAIADASQARRWLRRALAGLVLAPTAPLWLWGRGLRRLGRAAGEQRRFPPRDWKTYRDVRVLRGDAADAWARRTARLGRYAQHAALACVAAALAVGWWLA